MSVRSRTTAAITSESTSINPASLRYRLPGDPTERRYPVFLRSPGTRSRSAGPVGQRHPERYRPALRYPQRAGTMISLHDPMLGLMSDILDDLENTRIANENRLRQLTRTGEDSDGNERGFGLT